MTVLRYELPIDRNWHRIETNGEAVHVGCRRQGIVEFWCASPVDIHAVSNGMGEVLSENYYEVEKTQTNWYRVYPTGGETDGRWIGTTYNTNATLVWHLFMRDSEPKS